MTFPVPTWVVIGFLRLTRANRPYRTTAGGERHLSRRRPSPARVRPPRLTGVAIARKVEDGWPAFTLTPTNGEPQGAVLYAHGGAFVNEIHKQHWRLCARICREAKTTVIIPLYPLVPHGTAHTVTAGFAELATRTAARYGRTVLVGDSAGGTIALTTALQLRDAGHTAPPLVLLSPAVDLTLSNPSIPHYQRRDPWLGVPGLRVFLDAWRTHTPASDPAISPINADLARLPPITVYSGTRDILHPDIQRFITKAHQAGLAITAHTGDGQVHDYPLTPTRSGETARKHIIDTVRAALSPTATSTAKGSASAAGASTAAPNP